MKGYFGPTSVAHQLRRDEFVHLPTATKKKLIRLLSRVAEKSYRRGFQHGVVMTEAGQALAISPYKFRFERSLDRAPFPDTGFNGIDAKERLLMECHCLYQIGLVSC